MNPAANPGVGKVYKLKATSIRGKRVEIGHWRKPGTEGGAYGGTSPYMLLPGKKPPAERIGGGWGGAGAEVQTVRRCPSRRWSHTAATETRSLTSYRRGHPRFL